MNWKRSAVLAFAIVLLCAVVLASGCSCNAEVRASYWRETPAHAAAFKSVAVENIGWGERMIVVWDLRKARCAGIHVQEQNRSALCRPVPVPAESTGVMDDGVWTVDRDEVKSGIESRANLALFELDENGEERIVGWTFVSDLPSPEDHEAVAALVHRKFGVALPPLRNEAEGVWILDELRPVLRTSETVQ